MQSQQPTAADGEFERKLGDPEFIQRLMKLAALIMDGESTLDDAALLTGLDKALLASVFCRYAVTDVDPRAYVEIERPGDKTIAVFTAGVDSFADAIETMVRAFPTATVKIVTPVGGAPLPN